MRRLEFLIPGDLNTPTGGYIYDRRIIQGLQGMGWRVKVQRLSGSFPCPTPAALVQAGANLSSIPSDRLVLIDGLAMGSMPDCVVAESRRLRLVALVHHPLSAESGLSDEQAAVFRHSEAQGLAAAHRVVVTSSYTAGLVADLGVPIHRIDVIKPGTDPAPVAMGSDSAILNLLCVATLTHRKGHALLIDALSGLKDRDWRLTCVGSLDRDPATVSNLRDQLAHLGLEQRVTLTGELQSAALADLYHRADVFALATRFEGYGMALAEALACGLPVLSTRAGAVSETVPDGAGLLVPPGDPASLARALAELMEDSELRKRLAQGARAARGLLPSWSSACLRMDQVLRAAAT